MSLIVTLTAYLIAIAIPLLTVYVFVTQDAFGTVDACTLLICLLWGAVGAYGLALAINSLTVRAGLLNTEQVIRLSGPVIEEILNAAILVYIIRRPQFRYHVDGALYGIAVGVGFALSENVFIYLPAAGDAVLGTALSRVLSTSLMHATASGLVGISLGLLRRAHAEDRRRWPLVGLLAAIAVHLSYNNVVGELDGRLLLLVAIGMGAAGGLLVAWLIRRALAEEKRRFSRTLGLGSDVSVGERQAVQQLGHHALDALLDDLADSFGERNVMLIRRLLVLQANLGVLQHNLSSDAISPRLRAAWQREVGALHVEIAAIRAELSGPVQSFLRRTFPAQDAALHEAFNAEAARFDPTLVHTFDTFMRISELAGVFSPADLASLATRLSKIEIFKGVPLDDLETLSRAITAEAYPDGHVLFEQGDRGDAMMLIEDGIIHVSTRNAAGEDKLVATYHAGGVVGEFSLLDGHPRSARAQADGPVRVLILPRAAFMLFIQSRPHVILAMLRYLAGKSRATTDAIEASVTWMARIQRARSRSAEQADLPHAALPFDAAVFDFDPGVLSEATRGHMDRAFGPVAAALERETSPGEGLLRRLRSRPGGTDEPHE